MSQLSNKTFALFLVKRHAVLLSVSVICIFVLILLIVTAFSQFSSLNSRLTKETTDYQEGQRQLLASQVVNKKVADKVDVLKTFLPDKFELLSVLNVVESISKKTNFNIHSFSLGSPGVEPGVRTKKRIDIKGTGSFKDFLAFIKDYKFVSGQIISLDVLNLSGTNEVVSNLSIDIYAYEPAINLNNTSPITLDATDEKILKLVEENIQPKKESELTDNFKSKKNPFE